jgi:hypothetical protein
MASSMQTRLLEVFMVNRCFLIVIASGALLSAIAADYFPVQARNAWTFSYASTSAPVVPNPPATKDSGTVKWEIYSIEPVEMVTVTRIKQIRNLVRRTVTQSGIPEGYDSVFSPPRTTIDTVILTERIDQAGIGFSNATCSFAVHDPAIAMPAELSLKDTTVSFQGTPVACKKMIVSECSCLKRWYSYSFTLGPAIGPVEAYITMCPNLAGSAYRETWKLISRESPTHVISGTASPVIFKTIAVNLASGRIDCSLNLNHASPVRIEIFDLKGRVMQTLLKGNINAGSHRYSWSIPAHATGIAILRVRSGAEDRCVRIMTGIK